MTRRARTWLLSALAVIVALLVAAELFARFGLGLGDPALMTRDPEIEYLYQPSQEGQRGGFHYSYNRYGMRSRHFDPERSDPAEFRLLILSDSIMHGGSWVDQADIAPVVLEERLREKLDRPVLVANASVGSWGALNLLAYVNRYGFFDADMIVVLLNTGDYTDIPYFGAPLDAPETAPLGALYEFFSYYGMRKGRVFLTRYGVLEPVTGTPPSDAPAEEIAMAALRELLDECVATGAVVVVAQYLREAECVGPPDEGYQEMGDLARSLGLPVIQLCPAFREALERGEQPYLDGLHANPLGHRILADDLEAAVLKWMKRG